MRKVSKQVAMGFIERTLVRCKNFELTGRSCFSEPALQNVLFAATQVNGAGACTATDSHTGHGAPNRCVDTAKAGTSLKLKEDFTMTTFYIFLAPSDNQFLISKQLF